MKDELKRRDNETIFIFLTLRPCLPFTKFIRAKTLPTCPSGHVWSATCLSEEQAMAGVPLPQDGQDAMESINR